MERGWYNFKHEKGLVYANKIFSLVMTFAFAAVTLYVRVQVDAKDDICPEHGYYNIFWMLFIYYSFQGLDEMIEIYQEITNTPEKGALGLFFEMNYFFGAYITYRIMEAVFGPNSCKDKAPLMHEWLEF